MPLFDPDAILNNSDLVGPQKLFGSQPALDDAVVKQGFPIGRFVGGMRKHAGAEVNEWWDSRPPKNSTDKSPLMLAPASARPNHKPRNEMATPAGAAFFSWSVVRWSLSALPLQA